MTPEFRLFLEYLRNHQEDSSLENALDLMFEAKEYVIFQLVNTLEKCRGDVHKPKGMHLSSFCDTSKDSSVDPNFALVRRVIITPSKIYLDGPEQEVSNRVLRQYKDHTDNFVRVSITDENFQQMNTQLKGPIKGHVLKVLTDGMTAVIYV